MIHTTDPSIAKFQQFVELKDFRPPIQKEYVVRKCAEHFGCDPCVTWPDAFEPMGLGAGQRLDWTRESKAIYKEAPPDRLSGW